MQTVMVTTMIMAMETVETMKKIMVQTALSSTDTGQIAVQTYSIRWLMIIRFRMLTLIIQLVQARMVTYILHTLSKEEPGLMRTTTSVQVLKILQAL